MELLLQEEMEMAEEADGDGEGERKNPILAKNVVLLLRNLHISSGKCKAIPLWCCLLPISLIV
ncbi:unnamed protein product [Prunus armeniaca]|uniref:Uncharacterized protein n=1 Tax=Prunus armeniaca TaxID=36596 RepID=A0A6J5VKP9_PRUAR|nr:unnamed protein product [Prunus armeniaca]